MSVEIWKQHPQYARLLFSNHGRVCGRKGILKGGIGKNGYRNVWVDGKTVYVHREVAKLFVPNPEGHPDVLHDDDNKLNNADWNLTWGTQKMNMADALKNGVFPLGDKHYASKLTSEIVKHCRSVFIKGHREFGARALAKKYGVASQVMGRAIAGKSWKHE